MTRTYSVIFRGLAVALGMTALLLGLSACSSSPSTSDNVSAPIGTNTVLLDVRTPEEYAAGHLEGAELLDFNGGEFAATLPDLDPAGEYLVYCRSGNRSAQAVQLMRQAGIANVTDLGSLENAASATGIEVVSN